MLTNVRTICRLPAQKSVRVVHTPGKGAPPVAVTLVTQAGVLSIAAQTTSLGREVTILHEDGAEIVFANETPQPRISVLRYDEADTVAVQHVRIFEHALEVEHLDPSTSVKGLDCLALHLIRRRHCFDARARRPLPLALDAEPAPRIRDMQLAFTGSDAPTLVRLGLGVYTGAPTLTRAASKRRVHAGIAKFTSFFMFNANLVSRLSAYFTTQPLAYARGVSVNMALGAMMQKLTIRAQAPVGCIVRAETLTAAAVDAPMMAAIRALRMDRPCSAVKWRGAGSLSGSHSVYDASSLGMGLVAFAQGGTPVVVGFATPAASTKKPTAPVNKSAVDDAEFPPLPAAPAKPATDTADDLVNAASSAFICLTSNNTKNSPAPPGDAPPLPAANTAPVQTSEDDVKKIVDTACDAVILLCAKKKTFAPPAELSVAPGDVIAAAAVADMLFLHASSAEGMPLAPHARTLKTACYERHAASLDVDSRSILAALRDEASPGVFALAAELVFVSPTDSSKHE